MKLRTIVFAVLLLLVMSYGTKLALQTRVFQKDVEPQEWAHCEKLGPIVGVEDFVETPIEALLIGAADTRMPAFSEPGALYLIDLRDTKAQSIKIQTDFMGSFHPHGVDLYADEKGLSLLLLITAMRFKAVLKNSTRLMMIFFLRSFSMYVLGVFLDLRIPTMW